VAGKQFLQDFPKKKANRFHVAYSFSLIWLLLFLVCMFGRRPLITSIRVWLHIRQKFWNQKSSCWLYLMFGTLFSHFVCFPLSYQFGNLKPKVFPKFSLGYISTYYSRKSGKNWKTPNSFDYFDCFLVFFWFSYETFLVCTCRRLAENFQLAHGEDH
jgi:hypothetical protein